MERKIGMFYSWNLRGWGFIMLSPNERYFAHISEVHLDHIPAVGEHVSFVVTPPRKEGQLPVANDVRPIESAEAAGLAVLAGGRS